MKIIDTKINGKEAFNLIKRFAGFSLFSEKSEEDTIKLISKKQIYSMREIIGLLIISGIRNFDTFDINALSNAINCSIDDINKIFQSDLMKKCLPLKIDKKNAEENKRKLQKEIENIKRLENLDYTAQKIRFVREAIDRFNEWVRKGRIVIKE